MNQTLHKTVARGTTPGISARPALKPPGGFRLSTLQVVPDSRARATTARTPDIMPAAAPEFTPLRVLNGAVYFSGACETCRPFCGAVCCKGYAFVALTEEEANSGRYAHTEESAGCDCAPCQRMRQLRIKYALLKRPDGSCHYLDGTNRCSIYEDRPETCRKYSCANVAFRINP